MVRGDAGSPRGRRVKFATVAFLTLTGMMPLCGCSSTFYLSVESNTGWTAHIKDRTVDGYRDQEIDFTDDLPACPTVVKKTEGGELTARIIVRHHLVLFTGEDVVVDEHTTTDPYGSVTVCIDKH